jgi:bis(5'-nucleosyl)-tetraphosphatase (symmetrical)
MPKRLIIIGDLQGCFEEFLQLLDKLHFNSKKDTLWLAGDIVNRGPQSLACLRYAKKKSNLL